MHTMQLKNIGQIVDAEITFGNLTVLVGPQATGKSVALQFLKLLLDIGNVQFELARHGIDWNRKLPAFFEVYFGEGMSALWRKQSQVFWLEDEIHMREIIADQQPSKKESLFYVPAQRVLTLREGWPRAFDAFSPKDPFVVREFSERLRLLMQTGLHFQEHVFPEQPGLEAEFRQLIGLHILSGFDVKVDLVPSQKRLILRSGERTLPYMVWSAGQREFVPLLLGLYRLMTPGGTLRRGGIRWVVLEEPEMGLHPRAISVVLLLVFRLMQRGYRVCISTHSPQILEAIWAIQQLRKAKGQPSDFLSVFEVPSSGFMQRVAGYLLKEKVKIYAYYFDRDTGRTTDISVLDPTAEEEGLSGWGGLTEFSGRVNAVVARTVAND
jgi:hypothetical protein